MTEPGNDPFEIFSRWYQEAGQSGRSDPSRMALATAGPGNAPSVRIVLLKEVDRGLVFFTNYRSRKAREMELNPRAAALFHWEEPGTQVRVEGEVEKIPSEKSDSYFASRPRGSQLGAWASVQSSEIPSMDHLYAELARYRMEFDGKPVKRPPEWGGYRLIPDRFEFWKEGKNRLHERIEFRWKDWEWKRRLLSP